MVNLAVIAQGPLLIGVFLNAILLGVLAIQVYIYFTTFKKDPIWTKTFVAFLFFCDILNTALNIGGLYETLIIHFGDFEYLDVVSWLVNTDPAITGIIACATQLFYSWRIYSLTKNIPASILIVTIAMVGAVAAILSSVKIGQGALYILVANDRVPITLWLSSEVIADLIITVLLVRYLSQHRTGFHSTNLLVDRLIRTTIQTGLVTSLVATADLFAYIFDSSGLHLAFNYPLCKLYSVSLMSTLNSRDIWMRASRGGNTSNETTRDNGILSTDNTKFGSQSPAKPGQIAGPGARHAEVYVNVESYQMDSRTSSAKGMV